MIGTIVGQLVDAEGGPVADQVVIASSIERQGKFSRWVARGRTEGHGRFSLRATVGAGGVTNYQIALEGRLQLAESNPDEFVRVESNATVDVGVLKLVPRRTDRKGVFTIAVNLVDAGGGAVPGVTVTLLRAVNSEDGWSGERWEVSAKSDARGRAQLDGEYVGKKFLVVEPRELGLRRVRRELEITEGSQTLTVVLEKGLEIRGRLVDVDGRAVVRAPGEAHFGDDLQLHALDPAQPRKWIFADGGTNGDFRFHGLDDGRHILEVSRGPWSSICLDGVRAGATDVVVTLKRRDDPLDRGHHCAEIHARLVDADKRAPVAIDIEGVKVEKLDPGTQPAHFEVDIAPSFLWAPPVQTAWIGAYPADSDRVHVGSLSAGTYAFVVRAPGYAPEFVAPIALAAHEMRSDLVLSLVRPTRVVGRVLDIDSKPCANAFVLVNGIGPSSRDRLERIDRDVVRTNGHPRSAVWELARTDAQGKFAVEGLSPRYDYVIEALHMSFEPVSSSLVAGHAPGAVELRFAKKR